MKRYSFKTLQELYRVDNKYWKTGDTDILSKRRELAEKIDEEFCSEICGMTHMATQKHLPVLSLADALYMFGYVAVREEE